MDTFTFICTRFEGEICQSLYWNQRTVLDQFIDMMDSIDFLDVGFLNDLVGMMDSEMIILSHGLSIVAGYPVTDQRLDLGCALFIVKISLTIGGGGNIKNQDTSGNKGLGDGIKKVEYFVGRQ